MSEPSPYSGPNASAGATQFFSRLLRIKILLKRRWWVLLLTLALAVGAQLYRTMHGPAFYTSHAKLIIGGSTTPFAGGFENDPNNSVGTMLTLMKSEQMATEAADRLRKERPELQQAPVLLDVNLLPKTTIFYFEGKGKDPQYTQAYVETILNAYIDYRKQIRANSSDQAIKAIREQIVQVEKDLNARKKEVTDFEQTRKIAFVREEAASASASLITARTKLNDLLAEYQLIEVLGADGKANGQLAPNAPPATIDQEKARQQIEVYKAQQRELAVNLRPKHPKMAALTKLIADQEKLLEVFQVQSREQLTNRRTGLEKQIANQRSIVRDLETKSLASSLALSEFHNLGEGVQRAKDLYGTLIKALDSVKIVTIVDENINIVEHATVAKPDNANLVKNVAIGSFVGLIFGVGLLFFLDRFDDRPVSFTELSQQFEELVLGQIPQDNSKKVKKRSAPVAANDTRYAFIEAYRNLRSSLLFMAVEGERPRTILVTSAIPGEGKSTVASNLAITMAQSGSRVLLVDADMRKGLAHETFDLPDRPGLAEVLRQEKPWADAVQKTSVPNLFLLAHGAHPANPGELILTRSEHFLREVGQQFDYVVLDSAPVLAADDTASLSPKVDGVLFVIRASYTSARLSHNALETLYQRQVNVLGLVFNSIESNSREYYYFKYPEYYAHDKTAQK